jgi:hypothetical protein
MNATKVLSKSGLTALDDVRVEKLHAWHRERLAVVYVRQSSPKPRPGPSGVHAAAIWAGQSSPSTGVGRRPHPICIKLRTAEVWIGKLLEGTRGVLASVRPAIGPH